MQGRITVGFAVIIFLLSAVSVIAEDQNSTFQEQRELITSINLLNGLHLSGEQLQLLLQVNREAELLRQDYLRANEDKIEEAERYCGTLLEYYTQDRPAPDDVERNAQQLNSELREAEDAYNARLAELGARIEQVLTDGQRKTLDEFKPCLVPSRDLREPSRAGQAGSSLLAEIVLEQYRSQLQRFEDMQKNMGRAGGSGGGPGDTSRGGMRPPDSNREGRSGRPGGFGQKPMTKEEIQEQFFARFFPRYFDRFERIVGKMNEKERNSEKERVMNLFNRAAAMTDTEFSLNVENLAEELMAPISAAEEKLRNAMNTLVDRQGRPGRAARFLINPDLIPILKKRAIDFAEGDHK
jgi:hypothetical protein